MYTNVGVAGHGESESVRVGGRSRDSEWPAGRLLSVLPIGVAAAAQGCCDEFEDGRLGRCLWANVGVQCIVVHTIWVMLSYRTRVGMAF